MKEIKELEGKGDGLELYKNSIRVLWIVLGLYVIMFEQLRLQRHGILDN